MSFPFDLHSAAVSDSHLPCCAHAIPDHAFLLKATAQLCRRGTPCGCQRSASSGYHAEFHEVVIRRIPNSDAGDQCETKHRLSWTRKRVVAAHYKKDDLLHCWISSSDISGYHADMDTARSEQGRVAAWHV